MPSQWNTASFVPESCAALPLDNEVLSNEQNHIETEEDVTDPILLLECSSEPEFDTETSVFHRDNVKSLKTKPNPKKKSTYNERQKSHHRPQKTSCNRPQHLSKYLRCEHCGCFVLRSAVWLHRRRCVWSQRCANVGRKSSVVDTHSQNAAKSRGREVQFMSYNSLLNETDDDGSVGDVLNLVLDGDGESLQSVLTGDTVIRQYALLRMRSLSNQDCESSDDIYSLCQELRALARLVIECRRRKPCVDLYSLIHPDHFNLVVAISRKQTAMLVDVLGRAVNIKIVDTLQRGDNMAARHAWNFRELFVLWHESLAEDDAVLPTDDNIPQERHRSPDNRRQPLSQIFPQTINVDNDSDAQSESQEVYSQSDNTCLSDTNVLSDTFSDNPLQHLFPVGSFSTLALDRDGCFEQTSFSAAQCNRMDIQAVSDITHDAHVLDAVANDQHCIVTSHDVQRISLQSSSSYKSSPQAVTICQSSRENSYCYFCGQPQSQIQHHLKSVHAKEKEVIQLVSAATDAARVRSLTKLRNLGNHRHNQKVLQDGRGTLLVLYCPKPEENPDNYSPCNNCWNYMTEAQLLRHRCKLTSQRSRKRTTDSNCVSSSAVSSCSITKQNSSQPVSLDDVTKRKIAKPSRMPKAGGIQVASCHNFFGAKKYPCYFCNGWISKIKRHWMTHQNEPEMIKLMSFAKSDKRAKLQYATRLRHLGIHKHNVQVLKEGRGLLFVTRFAKDSSPADFIPCEYCLAYILKAAYWRHHRKCRPEWEQKASTIHGQMLLPTSNNCCDEVKEMLDGMTDGNVKLVAQSDQLIGEYAAKLLSAGFVDHAVKSKLRLLARFLLEIRKLTGLCSATLSECISPQNFHRCNQAADLLVGCDPETLSYRKSTSLKIRNILRQLSKLLKRDAIDRRDEHTVKDMDSFAKLCLVEWKCRAMSLDKQLKLNVETDSD